MVNKYKTTDLANKFRKGIENAQASGEFNKRSILEYFPNGCCDLTSELLAKYFIENGIKNIQRVHGSYYVYYDENESHVWILIDNEIIVDITGDQYKNNKSPFVFSNKVYVGNPTDFHNSFEKYEKEKYSGILSSEKTSLGNPSDNEVYEIIKKYIR